jgi:uncharacterized protein
MSERPLPRETQIFVSFVTLLRLNSFAVAPEQTFAFLAAIELLGPTGLDDIRRAGLATLAPPPDRHATYHLLFDVHFLHRTDAQGKREEGQDIVRLQEEGRGAIEPLAAEEQNESGLAASRTEALAARRFDDAVLGDPLRRLAREAASRLPRRRGHRRMRARNGNHIDLRRTLRESLRSDGEILSLRRTARRLRLRRLLVLIDVSGSMKGRTEHNVRLAHALVQAAPQVEVFTLGTRLTRVTRALRLKRREQALTAASHVVSDWDGGTRLGEALAAFLAVPRFSTYARGAAVLVISDGLERGNHDALRDSVKKLGLRAWHLSWMTPLASGPGFRPQTAALMAIRPFVDDMVEGGNDAAIVSHILSLPRARAA